MMSDRFPHLRLLIRSLHSCLSTIQMLSQDSSYVTGLHYALQSCKNCTLYWSHHCWYCLLCTVQIPFPLLAFLGPVSADFTAFPPFSTECTIVLTKERWTSFSCLHPLFPLQVSIWISDSSLHSLSKSGLFDLTLPSINHAYNASWFLCTISMHNLQSVFETSYLSIPPTMSL